MTLLSLHLAAVTQFRMTLQIKQLAFPMERYEVKILERQRQLGKPYHLKLGQVLVQRFPQTWE
jgi:hypothetical protein